MAEEQPGESEQGAPSDDRVGRLEARQDGIESKVDKILGILGGKESSGEPAHTDEATGAAGGSVAAEIRQQLDERDARARARADADAQKSELEGLKAKVAELSEKPPQPMPRRVEKIMGWH